MNRQFKFLLACGLAAVLLAAAVGHAAGVTVTVLPGVNPGFGNTSANGINNAGVVVGSSRPEVSGPPAEAAFWVDGVIETLPGLPDAPLGGVQFNAIDVNDAGVIVGITAFPTPENQFGGHAVKWVNGVPTDLGTLLGHDLAVARAINNAGQTAGTSSSGGFFGTQSAVRWSPDGTIFPLDLLPTQDPLLIEFGFPVQHDRGFASDINTVGRIVGHSGFGGDTPAERLPTYWDDTAVNTLPLPDGFNHGTALSINDSGKIVGAIADFDLEETFSFLDYRAAVWDDADSEPTPLSLPAGTDFAFAVAVNSHGQIIGGGANDASGALNNSAATNLFWSSDGLVHDLTPHLVTLFPEATRFTLTDINDLGQITGYADLPDFSTVAFVLTIPEPSSLALLACASPLVARRLRSTRTTHPAS